MGEDSEKPLEWSNENGAFQSHGVSLVGGLEHQFYFPICWESHHPNWRSYFSEGWPNHQPVLMVIHHFQTMDSIVIWCFWTMVGKNHGFHDGTHAQSNAKKTWNILWNAWDPQELDANQKWHIVLKWMIARVPPMTQETTFFDLQKGISLVFSQFLSMFYPWNWRAQKNNRCFSPWLDGCSRSSHAWRFVVTTASGLAGGRSNISHHMTIHKTFSFFSECVCMCMYVCLFAMSVCLTVCICL